MHYLGFVFVDEPTLEAVHEAMAPHGGNESARDYWDWYRPGGRWDGKLQGDAEMKRRETDGGFNFSPDNERVKTNCCRARDLPADMLPNFFVVDDEFIPKQHYDPFARASWAKDGEPIYGGIVETPDWEKRFRRAVAKYPDKWIVVVDAHN